MKKKEKVFIVSQRNRDPAIFREILGSKYFDIKAAKRLEDIEENENMNEIAAIIADYDFTSARVLDWYKKLQEQKNRTCLILYGEENNPEKISEMLQRGVYGFVPRRLITKNIYDTLIGGMENRRAFNEILEMIDELKEEKINLGKKNLELDFINRLSEEIAYDVNWADILPRIVRTGLLDIIDLDTIAILYRINSKWNFSCYLPVYRSESLVLEALKKKVVKEFYLLSGKKIAYGSISNSIHTYTSERLLSHHDFLNNCHVLPLRSEGHPLGVFGMFPKKRDGIQNGNREILSTILNILSLSLNNAQKYRLLKDIAIKDELTMIYNKKGFTELLEGEFLKAKRYNKNLSLIMMDVNNFKTINDSFGHLAGDFVLRELANCLKGTLRKMDMPARYGGDEFAIILPETESNKAVLLMKRVMSAIQNQPFKWKMSNISVSVSWGVATLSELNETDSAEELIAIADAMLYQTKRARTQSYRPFDYKKLLSMEGCQISIQ